MRLVWECAVYAARGSVSRANALAPFIGAFALWAVARIAGVDLAMPTTLGGGVLVLFACLTLAWLFIFAARFVYAPYHFLKLARGPRQESDEIIAQEAETLANEINQMLGENQSRSPTHPAYRRGDEQSSAAWAQDLHDSDERAQRAYMKWAARCEGIVELANGRGLVKRDELFWVSLASHGIHGI